MSIITITDIMGTSGSVSIDRSDFTEVIGRWFADTPETIDESIREQFLDLAEIIENGQSFTDEEAGELCRYLGLSIEFGAAVAENEIDNPNNGIDTIVVTAPTSGEEIARINLPASEESEPYDAALRTAGFAHFTWA